MRLLHFDKLGRLILTDFRGKPAPPYAILSHTWSDSEILMEDIASEAYKEKEEGYRKLQFCAKQAAQDQLQYFWIDTCCIDRWNLQERSKAINSMFLWYKNAIWCYVFLSDVSLSTTITETSRRSDWEASFRASVWFTRGWTLQELIAPVSVEFFSREGQCIGDKSSLDQLIHEATDIPLAALRNCPLGEFTISERRRWANNRRTTEEEDIVYCLLGVLGISMPTVYGEGQESARRRLEAEVEAAANVPSIIPFTQNQGFVGRESELASIEGTLFTAQQNTTILVIVGPGGTGKSQLALEVAHRTRQNKSCSVFWMDASDKDSLYQSYASVAQKLSIPGWDDYQADIKRTIKHCMVEISVRQCLLIFDNVENTALRSSGASTTEAEDLVNYLPQSKLCSAIFTTTSSETAKSLASQNVIELQDLTPDTALRMLQNCLATPLSRTEQQEAKWLLRDLSYLPLAVVQAAACMNASNMTVQAYQAKLNQHKELAIKHSSNSSEGKLIYDMKEPIAATLFLSLGQLGRESVLATNYLFLAACVNWKDISLDIFKDASPQRREDTIKLLSKYALVNRRPAESALDVHRLVHQALCKLLQVSGQLKPWIQCTITQLLLLFPDDDHRNRSKWRRLLPHAQYVLSQSQADEDNKERTNLAWRCSLALYSDGRYKEAEELQVQVMQTTKRMLGNDDPSTLRSMQTLASTYSKQGQWKDAEELQVQEIKIIKRVLGDEHLCTLTSIANLASTYWKQGRWNEAEELQVQVMQTMKRLFGDEHLGTLTSMNNLASTRQSQGRWKEAEELQIQVMQATKRVLGSEHPFTLASIGNLASTYRDQGQWKDAEELQMQAMQTTKRVLGDEHPDTLISMNNLALTYRNQRRWKEAEDLNIQVEKTLKRLLGKEHPHTLASTGNLALTYSNQGRWKEAEELELQVIETRKKVLGEEHPDTLTSISNLTVTYGNQGRWKEAEELELQVMETRKRVLGEEHPDTLTSISNLVSFLAKQRRYKEALLLCERACAGYKITLGKDHPITRACLQYYVELQSM